MLIDYIQYIRALHIIFVVTWFSGLFYIVRLFIYHVEAEEKPESDKQVLQKQFKIMEKRLWYIITWPSALLVIASGFLLVYLTNAWLQSWMLLKFGLVAGLLAYHWWCGSVFNQLQKNRVRYSSIKLRFLNEIATIFLISIVFVVELKDTLDWIWGTLGIMIVAGILTYAIKKYQRNRDSK